MRQASDTLREHKLKVTPQRLLVYEALVHAPGHLSADDVYKKVRKQAPAISLATVYSALEQLTDKGLIREIKISFDRSLFEGRTDGHHHFLCRRCRSVYDVDIHPCPTLSAMSVGGNTIDDFQGYFYGMCKKCASKRRRS